MAVVAYFSQFSNGFPVFIWICESASLAHVPMLMNPPLAISIFVFFFPFEIPKSFSGGRCYRQRPCISVAAILPGHTRTRGSEGMQLRIVLYILSNQPHLE